MGNFDESKIRYLEMIQNVVSRMASNTFLLKSWTVTLVAGILALSSKETDNTYIFIAFIPIVIFWFLDSYYLQLERKYRAVFDYIRNEKNAIIDFDLNHNKANKLNSNNKKLKFISCFFSKTELLFYVPTGIFVGIIIKFIHSF